MDATTNTTRADDAENLSLRLDRELVDALREQARQNDRSVSAEARRAIRAYLKAKKEITA